VQNIQLPINPPLLFAFCLLKTFFLLFTGIGAVDDANFPPFFGNSSTLLSLWLWNLNPQARAPVSGFSLQQFVRYCFQKPHAVKKIPFLILFVWDLLLFRGKI